MSNEKPSLYTLGTATKKRRPNAIRQMVVSLGLIAIVAAVPITLLSILQPEGSFETRREASSLPTYTGYVIDKTTSDGVPIDGYYFVDANENLINFGIPTTTKYVIIPSDYSTEILQGGVIGNGIYSLINSETASIDGEYYLATMGTDASVSYLGDDTTSEPSITAQDSTGIIRADEFHKLKFDLINNTEIPIQSFTLERRKYDDGSDIGWNSILSWSDISAEPDDLVGQYFPQTFTIIGYPQADAIGKTYQIDITVVDVLGNEATLSQTYAVKENNEPPVINAINCREVYRGDQAIDREVTKIFNFETGCIDPTVEYMEVVCEIDAVDVNEDTLRYSFSNIDGALETVPSSPDRAGNPPCDGWCYYNWIKFFLRKVNFPNATHSFTVTGEVKDSNNGELPLSDSQEFTLTINTTDYPCTTETSPTASFTATPTEGNVPLVVKFDPTASNDPDGDIVKYKWTFGDGQEQEYNNPVIFEHTYTSAGIFNVKLEVTDNDGEVDSTSSSVTAGINQAPSVTLSKPNSGIYSGSQNILDNKIVWSINDEEKDEPLEYKVELLSTNSGTPCNSSSLSDATSYEVTKGNMSYDDTNSKYFPTSYAWNTETSLSGDVPDGYYCVKISVIDNDSGHHVSDFSDATIQISNAEHAPYISTTSIPDGVKGESYSTEITAVDEDEDNISYSYVYGPSWLSLSDTGTLFGTPTETGPFVIIIAVTDGKAERSRSFSLNIKATEGQVLPAITINPSAEVFIGSDGKINWSIANAKDVSSLTLQYSTDGKEWMDLKSGIAVNESEYIWDVTELEPGKYQVRLLYIDKDGNKLGASTIQELEVAKPEQQEETSPIIFNLKPTDESTSQDATPVISANFAASTGGKVLKETIKVYFNSEELTDDMKGVDIFEGGFSFIPQEELSAGEHYIKAGFKDSTDKVIEKKWSFKVVEEGAVAEEGEEEGFKFDYSKYILAIGTILFIGAATVIAYFIVKKLQEEKAVNEKFSPKLSFKKDEKDKETKEEEKIFEKARVVLEKDSKKKDVKEPKETVKPIELTEVVEEEEDLDDIFRMPGKLDEKAQKDLEILKAGEAKKKISSEPITKEDQDLEALKSAEKTPEEKAKGTEEKPAEVEEEKKDETKWVSDLKEGEVKSKEDEVKKE